MQEKIYNLREDQIEGKELDHLGLLAGVMKKIRLVERIDKQLPISKEKGANVTMGERVAAMILNALGFIDSRLYMFVKFLENKPIDRLLGSHLKAEYFTDDALGRCLDAIYEYGPTKFFADLVFSTASQLGLLGKSVHIDTTTLSVYGSYDKQENGYTGPKVTYGYAKNKRVDLKQLTLGLATTGKAELPMFMASLSGNASDQKTLIQMAGKIKQFYSQFEDAPSFNYVADSAMYESCLKTDEKLTWISRVPAKRKEAKHFIRNHKAYDWQAVIGTGYKIHAEEKNIAGVKQRWALVFSEQACEQELKTLKRNKEKEHETASKKLLYLSKELYGCPKDAEKVLNKLQKGFKYHQIIEVTMVPKLKYEKTGRPRKGEKMHVSGYHIKALLAEDNEKIEALKAQKGLFVLATNQLDKNELSDEELLSEYKNQQKTERGFAFIKDNAFEVSSVFLKKPSRISALMAIMSLSLFVYTITQYLIREALKDKKEFVLNQLGKKIQNPTAKWIFFLFRGIQVIRIRGPGGHTQELVINLKPLLKTIIGYLGVETMSIYGVVLPQAA